MIPLVKIHQRVRITDAQLRSFLPAVTNSNDLFVFPLPGSSAEGPHMKFQVIDHSTHGTAMFSVDTECGKNIDSFSTIEEAQDRAAWLEAEYERISETL
ncbi:hypothetical protein BZ163_14215 [Pseudomonas sp. VI4.1]|nr:hypothetical protein BZ163_14215 [Pseudomonas sp. VI4.1]